MAQSADIVPSDTAQEVLSVDGTDLAMQEESTISPVYRRPKDDTSPAPSSTSRIALSEAEIRSLMIEIHQNIPDRVLNEALDAVQDRSDVFAVQQYLAEHRDEAAEMKAAFAQHLKNIANPHNSKYEADDNKQNATTESADVDGGDAEEKADVDGAFPVRVFVRVRPLIRSEIEAEHKEITYNAKRMKSKTTMMSIEDSTARNVRKSAIQKAKAKGKTGKAKLKKFKGFGGVLSAEIDNHATFEQCILPSIGNLLEGRTVCVFAYGHTGSGKTHTIMGYDKEESPGMYRLTAGHIDAQLKQLNADIKDEEDQLLLSCRFAELYQGKMRDLFGNLVECHVREDDNGNVVIRGPTLTDESGRVKVSPLTPCEVRSGEIDQFLQRVTSALSQRKQGSSAVHDESSRSHVFLEMELVSRRVITARAELWDVEAEMVPIGHAMNGHWLKTNPMSTGFYHNDPETNEWKINDHWKEDPENRRRANELGLEFLKRSIKKIGAERVLQRAMAAAHTAVGGKVVFVDLAGNEWASDSALIKNDSAVQQSERKEINKSLLALKECVRAMNGTRDHVPFRNSKLTMVLRPHLKAESSTAIMVANVSPSQHHIKKTFNTLSYSALVAKA